MDKAVESKWNVDVNKEGTRGSSSAMDDLVLYNDYGGDCMDLHTGQEVLEISCNLKKKDVKPKEVLFCFVFCLVYNNPQIPVSWF